MVGWLLSLKVMVCQTVMSISRLWHYYVFFLLNALVPVLVINTETIPTVAVLFLTVLSPSPFTLFLLNA